MKKLTLLSLVLLMLSLSGLAMAQDEATVTVAPGDNVVLGFAAALTGEGVAAFGIDIQRGVELALEDRPVVTVDGEEFPVTLDVQDSLCTPEGGQTVANRFVSDQSIVAVVGPMCSSSAEAAASIFDAADYSSVSASATAATLTTSDYTSFNRTVATDAAQGLFAAELIVNELGVTRVAFIDDGSTYGAGLVDVIIPIFEELGGTVVARDAVTVGETDFRALLENIAAQDPELIYFGGFNAEGARLVEQRFDVGLEDTLFLGADGIFGPEIVNLAGESTEGIYTTRPIPYSSDDLAAFTERYIDTYGEEPASAFNTNAYDATNLILNAIESVGTVDEDGNLVISRADLRDYLRSAEMDGLTGTISCDGTGECSPVDIGFYQVQDGEWVQLELTVAEEDMEAEEAE